MPFPNAGWNKGLRKAQVTKEDLEDLYHKQHLSQSQIGAILGISQKCVGNYMRELGIPSRGKSRAGKENGRYTHGRYVGERVYRQMIDKDLCKNCGGTKDLGIHHINFDHYDNRLENLQVLCASCHNSLHKKRYWKHVRDSQR